MEPCCLARPRHKFSCKRLLQKQQLEGSDGSCRDARGWDVSRNLGEGRVGRVEGLELLQEEGRFMTPSGIPVARLQVRLDGCLPTLLHSGSRAAISNTFIYF